MTDTTSQPAAPPTDAGPADASVQKLGGKAAWYALILVALIQAMSMVDRQILAILMPQIKADLKIGDAEMGLLYGTVFALFYAVFSLPLGRLADGWIRTRLLGICIAGWSGMTALAGFANGFGLLALSRLGVGIGEAAVQPAGMSLVSDMFPKKMRGTITAIIAASIALGLGMALTIGGAIADGWDSAFAAGTAPLGLKGWQAAFIGAALPGLVLAVLIIMMKEPVRGVADGIKPTHDPKPFTASAETLGAIMPGLAWLYMARRNAPQKTWIINIIGLALIVLVATLLTNWTNSLREINPIALSLGGLKLNGNELQWIVSGLGAYIMLNWVQSIEITDKPTHKLLIGTRSTVLLIVIASLQTIINYGCMAWTPTFLIKSYGLTPTQVGMAFGPLSAGLGIIGPLIAGPFSDWINTKFSGGRLYVTLGSLTLSPIVPFWVFNAQSPGEFYLAFALFSLLLTMWLPPIYASFMDLVLPRMRGSMMSFYILTMTIVGLGLGPYLVGLMSDLNGGNLSEAILNLFWISPVLIVLSVLLIRSMPKDEATVVERAREAGEQV